MTRSLCAAVAIVLMVGMGGCANEDAHRVSPAPVSNPSPALVKPDIPKTHWRHVVQFVETYDQCVRDSDGLILIETMHASGESSDSYGVYERGAEYGEYATANQAKDAAVVRHPECKPNGHTSMDGGRK